MKRKAVPIAFFLFLFTSVSFSQPWHYSFGDSVKSFTTSNGASTTFLPAAPSGTSRIRLGAAGGSFNLQSTAPPEFGTGTYLRIAGPTTTSVNKFSIYDYPASTTYTFRMNTRFGASDGSSTGAASGTWYLIFGDGASYSDANGFSGAQTFSALRFVHGAGGVITIGIRVGSNWVATGLTTTAFQQGLNYSVEIYGNNSSTPRSYTYGTLNTVGAYKWDLWINGVLVGDDLGKALLANDGNIDSWMLYGESSTGNSANIFLDEIDYTNEVTDSPLPVTLGSFNMDAAGRDVTLNWQTLNELNNAGFEIERCRVINDLQDKWSKIAFVGGHLTTGEPISYSYRDKGLNTGVYKYRLKQVDVNGNYEYFSPQNALAAEILKPSEFSLLQNYPNPSNPASKINFNMPFDGNITLKVYDITGKEAAVLIDGFRTADFYSVNFDGSDLPSGVYFYRLIAESSTERFTKTLKMILLK